MKSPASTSTAAQFITHTAAVKGERHSSTESGAVYDRRRAFRGFHSVSPTSKAPGQHNRTLALLREPETTFRFILRAQSSTPKPLASYAERTREFEARAMPLFSGAGR